MRKYVGKRKGEKISKKVKKKRKKNQDLVFMDAIRYAQDSFSLFSVSSMPDSTSNPVRISGIAWRRKKSAISLLAVWHLALLRLLLRLLLLLLLLLLLVAFKSSPMISLPLIAVIYQESQGACECDDDEGFNNSLVDVIEAV